MRINVYSQELTTEVNLVEKYAENVDRTFSGAQLILHSSPRLHHTGRTTIVARSHSGFRNQPNAARSWRWHSRE